MSLKSSLLKRNIAPSKQGGFMLVLYVVAQVFVFVFLSRISSKYVEWEITLSLMLFYALINSIYYLNAQEKNVYVRQSLLVYFLISIIMIIGALWLSDIDFFESRSLKWLVLLFTFCYFIFLAIVVSVRRIVERVILQDRRMRGEQ